MLSAHVTLSPTLIALVPDSNPEGVAMVQVESEFMYQHLSAPEGVVRHLLLPDMEINDASVN